MLVSTMWLSQPWLYRIQDLTPMRAMCMTPMYSQLARFQRNTRLVTLGGLPNALFHHSMEGFAHLLVQFLHCIVKDFRT